MAITTTPLGFKKPDGNESLRNGDNVIAANAQKAEDTIAAVRARLANVESAAFVGGGLLMEDPADPGFFIVGGTP